MTLDSDENGAFQDVGIAVGEPGTSEKFDCRDALEKRGVGVAVSGPGGIFADVTAEGGELAGAFYDPVVPGFGKDRAGAEAWGKAPGGAGLAVGLREGLFQLPDQDGKRFASGDRLEFQEQVDVVGHDDEGGDFLEALPLEMEVLDDGVEGAGEVVFDEAVGADFGECGKPFQTFEGHHVEEGRRVVEMVEAHGKIVAGFEGEARREEGGRRSARGQNPEEGQKFRGG